MSDRFRPPALAGLFDPRGRLERESAAGLIGRALGRGAEVPFADPWLAAGCVPRNPAAQAGGCVLIEGRIENREALAGSLGLQPATEVEAVVAAASAAWGEAMLARLRGSFALLTWNGSRRSGVLAVDQLGGRSLFYSTLADGSLAFASEVVTLLELVPTRPGPNHGAVVEWLVELAVPAQATVYDGVERLGAAHCLELSTEGWRRRPYWFPHYEPPLRGGSRAEHAEALWENVVRAVDGKLDLADEPGIILSGGIDSSVVAAAAVDAVRRGKRMPRSYSAVFPGDARVDESERIEAVTAALGIAGVQLPLRPSGAFACALDYLDAWSLPLQGPGAALERPLLERAAADGVTVALDGQAGDELFGRPSFLIADRLRRGRILSSFALAARFPAPSARSRRRPAYRFWKLAGLQGAIPGPLHSALRRMRARERRVPDWLIAPSGSLDPQAPNPWSWKKLPGPRWWAYKAHVVVLMRDAIGANDYLRHRAARVGIDARPPLLDLDLIDFVLRLPPELGFDATLEDRPLIREAMRGRVPDVVRLNSVKSNVASFYYETLAGRDLEPIRRLLLGGNVEIGAYVDRAKVEALIDRPPGEGAPGWYEWFSSVWRLATMEAWLRQQSDSGFAARAAAESDVLPPGVR